jgi:hypothetical protein
LRQKQMHHHLQWLYRQCLLCLGSSRRSRPLPWHSSSGLVADNESVRPQLTEQTMEG